MVKFLNAARVAIVRKRQPSPPSPDLDISVSGFVRLRAVIASHQCEAGDVATLDSASVALVALRDAVHQFCDPATAAASSSSQPGEATVATPAVVFHKGVAWHHHDAAGADDVHEERRIWHATDGHQATKVIITQEEDDGGLFVSPDLNLQSGSIEGGVDDGSVLRVSFLCCYSHVKRLGVCFGPVIGVTYEVTIPLVMHGGLPPVNTTTPHQENDSSHHPANAAVVAADRNMVRQYPLPPGRSLEEWAATPPPALVQSVEGCLREVCFKVGLLPKYGA